MPLSMKRQTAKAKKALIKQKERIIAREKALAIIKNESRTQNPMSNRKTSPLTNILLQTVDVLRNAVRQNKEDGYRIS